MSMSVVPFSTLVEDGIFFPVTYYLNGFKSRLKSLFLVTPCHPRVFKPFVEWSSNEKKIFLLKTAFFASILLTSFFFLQNFLWANLRTLRRYTGSSYKCLAGLVFHSFVSYCILIWFDAAFSYFLELLRRCYKGSNRSRQFSVLLRLKKYAKTVFIFCCHNFHELF